MRLFGPDKCHKSVYTKPWHGELNLLQYCAFRTQIDAITLIQKGWRQRALFSNCILWRNSWRMVFLL